MILFALNEKEDENHKVDLLAYEACYNVEIELLSQDWKAQNKDRESVLDRDMAAEKNVGVIIHPSATINGKTFRGDYKDSN